MRLWGRETAFVLYRVYCPDLSDKKKQVGLEIRTSNQSGRTERQKNTVRANAALYSAARSTFDQIRSVIHPVGLLFWMKNEESDDNTEAV